MIKAIILCNFLVIITACQEYTPKKTSKVNPSQTDHAIASRIEAHMDFLASDLLQGRQTGSREYDIAASYVATQMQQYGLEPAGTNGDWYQGVALIKSTLMKESVRLKVNNGTNKLNFTFIDDFTTSANPISTEDILQGELVFVGYGIDSEAMEYNDYANLDVAGKIVIALRGRPEYFPTEQGAHLASGSTKREAAIEHGAVGFFQIHTPKMEAIRKFESYQKYALAPAYNWQGPDGKVSHSYPELKGSGYLSTETGAAIFSIAGFSLDDIFAAIDNNEQAVGFPLNIQLSMQRKTQHETLSSPNVVAKLVGSDPLLQQEYVIYSAHLDHIGVDSHSKQTDVINNGALDNASGVAVMLETARRFAEGERPKRSLLFVAVTAEEKGLIGSSYFTTHPTVSKESMVANINLDMPLILYPFGDVIAFGSEHSTLGSAVATAAANNAIKLSPDPMPEQVLFVRSDHYSFVKQGVPSIFLVPGFDSKDPNIDGKKVFSQFLEKHYHQPSDDLQLPINYDAAALFTKVNYEIGVQIANAKQRPRWHEGNFFGELFAKKTKSEDSLEQHLETKLSQHSYYLERLENTMLVREP